MTMAADKQDKVLNFSSEREQSGTCSCSAEREKNQGKNFLNVPTLRFPEFSGEWEKYKLGDIMEFTKERISSSLLTEDNYVSTENMLQDFQGVACAHNVPENTNVMEYKQGDVLVSNIRPYLKKVWMADKDGGCSADVFVMRANRNVCTDDFLHHIVANDRFVGYVMSGAKGVKMPRGDKEQMKGYETALPSLIEQQKVAHLLAIIDERISTQIRIIEDLKQLRSALIELLYSQSQSNYKIGDMIVQVSNRNRNEKKYSVLSVNNRLGFIEQSEQFEDRTVASDDTSNYKVVNYNDFAYNPARINVGSIARLTSFEDGIVSPMYICFHAKQQILPEYLEYFFYTKYFHNEMLKRLEGSVRMCLSWDSLCNIPLTIPNIEQQRIVSKRISILTDKIIIEEKYKEYLMVQKHYLLKAMFI